MTAADGQAAPADGATATCVFAIRRREDSDRLAGSRGHAGGGPLRLLPISDALCAVVQDVPAADFSQEALRRRLSDPVDLEACARTHHAVVTAAAADGPALPLPLATLFTDGHRAVAALGEQQSRFLATLDLLAGRAEWAVKISVAGKGAAADRVRENVSPQAAGRGTGAAYLSRVRGREHDRRIRQEAVMTAARHAHETATALAVAGVRRRPHGTGITGPDLHQVLNAAYLVENDAAADLVCAVRALEGTYPDLDLHIDVSGPWVPYSFTDLAQQAGA